MQKRKLGFKVLIMTTTTKNKIKLVVIFILLKKCHVEFCNLRLLQLLQQWPENSGIGRRLINIS